MPAGGPGSYIQPMGRLRILIAGGGVAAAEALIGLHKLAGDRVDLSILSNTPELVNRPSSVAQPFAGGGVRRLDLGQIASDCGARLHHGTLDGVDLECREVQTRGHARIGYDVLLVAVGARLHDPLPGAMSFRGPESADAFRALLQDLHVGRRHDLVFTIPIGSTWPLPIYELALLTAARMRVLGAADVRITVATPEDRPLRVFGQAASDAVADLLEHAGVQLLTGVFPVAVEPGSLRLTPNRTLPADRVVTLPQLRGPAIPGLPTDGRGFIETDPHGLVLGTKNVYAAGDATAFEIKHGGLAAQQADAAAEAIAARAGVDIDPMPFHPVLRGLLLAGAGRRFMSSDLVEGQDVTAQVRESALWWPPTKVAARHLGAYLTETTGGVVTDAPDDPDAIPVEIDAALSATPVS